MDNLQMLSIEQAAAELAVSTKTIRRRIEDGSIRAVNVGATDARPSWRIRRADLSAWLDARSRD